MEANIQQLQTYLREFDFQPLFYEELGWDHLKEAPLTLSYQDHTYTFVPLAEKRGFKVYTCLLESVYIPNDQTLKQIDRLIEPYAKEHLVIYLDAMKENQIWLWVKREVGKPALLRVNKFHRDQNSELLAQKLADLAIAPEMEEQTDHMTIIRLVRGVFDIDKDIKKFYEQFKKERSAFLSSIRGIVDHDDLEWYTTVMLSRLMFIYFIQKKGFLDGKSHDRLDGDLHYLRHRLQMTQSLNGTDSFYSFYRYFLLRLFHNGLSKRQRTPELEQVIGKVPYLNGGLFDVHDLETKYDDISISDEAFEHLFNFFEHFDWHVDDRPSGDDKELNPDILGYIFEKHVNEKAQGAYYTKDDITNYIGKNTVIPSLFDYVQQQCPLLFTPEGPIWSLLHDNLDDYIYEIVTWGVDEPLPQNIEIGIHDLSQRTLWNKVATNKYTLIAETWREVIARRQHYSELHTTIAISKMISIDDLITYNLNIRQFAEDVIATCDSPELLMSFYQALKNITILDPTCGSGAFLFATLNILQPLYQVCLQRMRLLMATYEREETQPFSQCASVEAFRAILKKVDTYHSQEYYILKSIIIDNLYGVDILKEAVEICKLRLFLKLVAQVAKPQDIEPLPDVDFNVLAGNTLIGFAKVQEVRQIVAKNLFGEEMQGKTLTRIEEQIREIEQFEESFRHSQLAHEENPDHFITEYKRQIRMRLSILKTELDQYLASEYGIDRIYIPQEADYQKKYAQWLKTHQPFHWLVAFGGIMRRGGFHVIIGNPPYVEYNAKKSPYHIGKFETLSCSNLYPFITERSYQLLSLHGRQGMILPLSAFATKNMAPFIQKFQQWFPQTWLSFYHFRPSMLFSGGKVASIATSIYLAKTGTSPRRLSTPIFKWSTHQREHLFPRLTYRQITTPTDPDNRHYYPKFMHHIENEIMQKILPHRCISNYLAAVPNQNTMFYRSAGGLYWKVFINYPWPYQTTSNKQCSFQECYDRDVFVGLFNSSLFWWYYTVTFDTFNLKDYMIFGFRFPYPQEDHSVQELKLLCQRLMNDYRYHAKHLKRGKTDSYTFYVRASKSIIDDIDRMLAKLYGLTDEELDFIMNYDIKYRINSEESEE